MLGVDSASARPCFDGTTRGLESNFWVVTACGRSYRSIGLCRLHTELPDLTTNSIENNTLVQSTGADIWPSTVRNYANTTNNDFLSGLPSSKEEPTLSSPGDVARTDALDLTTRRLLNTEESSTNTLPPAATTSAHYGSTDNNLEVTDVVPGEKWIILVIIAGIITLVPGQYVKDIGHYCEIGCRKIIYGIQWSSGVQ